MLVTLGDQAVEVLIVGALETEIAAANVVNGLIVDHEGAVRVLKGGVGSEDRVVGLDNGSGRLRSGVDTELQFALLAVVNRQPLHQQGTEARSGTTTEGVEDQETLETSTAVRNTSNLVQNLIDKLLAYRIMATGVVVGSILFASNHLLGVEETSVGTGADLIDNIGLEITVNGTRDVLALTCSGSKSVR